MWNKIQQSMLITCLYSGRDNSMPILFLLCQATVTLNQGQGHRNENKHNVCHTLVYSYAKFECSSLNIIRDITIKLQVKQLHLVKFEMRRSCDSEWRSMSTDWQRFYWRLVDNLHSKSDGHWTVSEKNRTCIIFRIKIFVNLNEGQGEKKWYTWRILISGAATVPSVMMMTSIMS